MRRCDARGTRDNGENWFLPPSGYGQIIPTESLSNKQPKCIDVTNGANTDGTKLQIFDCVTGNTNQIFSIDQFVSLTDTISWVGTNKCVDLTGGNTTSGNEVCPFEFYGFSKVIDTII